MDNFLTERDSACSAERAPLDKLYSTKNVNPCFDMNFTLCLDSGTYDEAEGMISFLYYSNIRMKIKFFPFYCCSNFPLYFVLRLESRLSMFTSTPVLLHIFSYPNGGQI